jgi:hypothetical protein
MARLYDPAPTDGGGGAAESKETAEKAAPRAEPATPAKAEPKPGKVEVEAAELESMRARLAEIDKAEKERIKAEKDKADEEARQRGEYDRLLREKDHEIHDRENKLLKARGDYEALERDTARSFVEGQLAVALSLPNLVDKAPGQLMKLFRDEFKATREDGRWVVRSLDGRTPDEFIGAELEKPEYSHFKKAGHQGGGGGGNTPPTTGHEGPDEAARRKATAARLMAGRGGMPSNSFGGFANGVASSSN